MTPSPTVKERARLRAIAVAERDWAKNPDGQTTVDWVNTITPEVVLDLLDHLEGAAMVAAEEARLHYALESVLDLVEKADWQINKRGDAIACHLFLDKALRDTGRRKENET